MVIIIINRCCMEAPCKHCATIRYRMVRINLTTTILLLIRRTGIIIVIITCDLYNPFLIQVLGELLNICMLFTWFSTELKNILRNISTSLYSWANRSKEMSMNISSVSANQPKHRHLVFLSGSPAPISTLPMLVIGKDMAKTAYRQLAVSCVPSLMHHWCTCL